MDSTISAMAQVDRKITLQDLPESITGQLLDESKSRHLIIISPRPGVLSSAGSMERFDNAMNKISPRVTGSTQIVIAWMADTIPGSQRAALYIFLAAFMVILLTFRSLRYAVLAIAPLVMGMIWMLGIYPLLGMKLNFFNIAVIPLVIGMGIDFGIHLVHRSRVEQDIETVYRYTGKAVFLSALTTMIGFGSLALIGSFPSIVSLGATLFLGIASCLATSLFVLPALLTGRKAGESVQA